MGALPEKASIVGMGGRPYEALTLRAELARVERRSYGIAETSAREGGHVETNYRGVMLDWSTIIAQLKAHANAHDLIARAERGCAACFRNEGGSIDGWTVADFRTEFHSHKLAFRHATFGPYVETTLTLHANDETEIGRYRLITDREGQDQDDYLVFYRAKDH